MFFDASVLSALSEKLRDGEIFLRLDRTSEADPIKGYVPACHFGICRIEDGTELGWIDLRLGHNRSTAFGGNIGYAVHEPFRGRHFAGKACRLLPELARAHGMKTLFITCAPENEPSRRTCLYAGARLMDVADIPEWHELYAQGRRKACRYRLDL